MAFFFADLVRETSFGVGAGALTLAGALPGHRRFGEVVPQGASFLYCIAGVTHPGEWETGEGAFADGLLVRTAVDSSTGGPAVAFSPGLKTVALTATAAWFARQEAAALTGLSGFGRSLLDDADAVAARATLGLGSIATQNASNVAITGGSVTGLTGTVTTTSGSFPSLTDGKGGFYGSASLGLVFTGRGAVYDIYFCNKNGTGILQVPTGTTRVEFQGDILTTGLFVGGSQVVAARRTGWATPTGTASRGAFDASSVTVAQLAERVKALIDDLTAHGLIGS